MLSQHHQHYQMMVPKSAHTYHQKQMTQHHHDHYKFNKSRRYQLIKRCLFSVLIQNILYCKAGLLSSTKYPHQDMMHLKLRKIYSTSERYTKSHENIWTSLDTALAPPYLVVKSSSIQRAKRKVLFVT